MRTPTLVLRNSVFSWALGSALACAVSAYGAGSFGSVIPLAGHLSEVALDEPRSALYAANFTAGQVDVISTASNRLVSSIKVGGQPSGLALSPDGRHLVVTNYNNFGTPNLSSVVVINLNDLSRVNYALSNPPLAVAFGADNKAVIATTVNLQRFDPVGGTFEVITTIASLGSTLPVVNPKFPREITRASMTSSGDANYLFGLTDSFVFVYQVPAPTGVLNVRLLTSLVHALVPPLVSAAFDGSYFMAGQYLMDRRLRVMAEQPDLDFSQVNLGGHAIDFGARTIYGSFTEPGSGTGTGTGTGGTGTGTGTGTGGTGTGTGTGTGGTGTGTGTTGLTESNPEQTSTVLPLPPPRLFIQDADNLTIRDRLKLTERLTGRVVVAGGGRYLYGVSESGILYLPVTDVAGMPQVRPNTEQVFVQFDFCQRSPIKKEFRIEGPAGTDFEITTNLLGVTFSPQRGVTPATVEVTVDFARYSGVQGTSHGQILVTSQNGINQLQPIQLDINVKDADQRGRIHPLPGKLVDILADPRRDQFYVLEQNKNELHVFQNSDLRLLGTYRTGNRPNWMTFSADRRFLIVANSFGENVTVINLDSRQNQGYLFLPAGHNPISVAADNGTTLAAVRIPGGAAQLDAIDVLGRVAYGLGRLGVYENLIHINTAMVPLANMSGIFLVEADGKTKLWDAAAQEVVISRKDFGGLLGAVAAGPSSLVVGNQLLNQSLVLQATFTDTPNTPAGFTFVGDQAVRTSSPPGVIVDTGAISRFDVRNPAIKLSPVRMVESPLTVLQFPFLRSLAGLRNGAIVSTSTTGLVELPGNFDAGIAIPRVSAITSAADFTDSLAPGSLVSIFGQNLAPAESTAGSLPLPTQLSNTCVTVNGFRMPLLYVSPGQINGQLPFELMGQLSTVLHTPGGRSDIYYAQVQAGAPSIFQLRVSGQEGTFPAVIRARNNQLATLSNPLRPNETGTVFLTGLGEVTPQVEAGTPAPASPLASALRPPAVTVGGHNAAVLFAGLAPGFAGLYQLNFLVPPDTPRGMQIPLAISSGGGTATVNVRIVE